MGKPPYQNKEWLREKYHTEGLTGDEIADLAGCARTTIYDWMQRHDIPRDRGEGYRVSEEEKYRDGEWLRSKYHGEQLSTGEIADICDCHKQTIKLWLEKHGIEKRSRSKAAEIRARRYPEEMPEGRSASIHPNFFTRDAENGGYEWIGCGVTKKQVMHHRLLATLLVDELSELEGMHVHHTTECPWLNYLDGLEVVTPKEHKQRHA